MEHFFLLLAAEEALLARLEMPLELVGPAHQCGYLGVDDTEISIKSKANFSSLRGIFIATAQFRVIFIAKAKILPPPSVRAYLSVSGRSRGALVATKDTAAVPARAPASALADSALAAASRNSFSVWTKEQVEAATDVGIEIEMDDVKDKHHASDVKDDQKFLAAAAVLWVELRKRQKSRALEM